MEPSLEATTTTKVIRVRVLGGDDGGPKDSLRSELPLLENAFYCILLRPKSLASPSPSPPPLPFAIPSVADHLSEGMSKRILYMLYLYAFDCGGRMEPRVGNKFRLGRKIGSGSFGEIYLGLWLLYLWIAFINRVEFVHSKSFLHRDIKPDNFIMGLGRRANQVCL
ncbi:hypothetical protein B296_00025637 [Ensete ventricosum]|uniref:Protein kinase domain-containing protein n=1 Tax=Ensete ventricosum TaxID=4639 RepID=A0A426YLH7_ENSVE|nr:hypothetical protein B296_00025637 [Ensete ventricosum]